MALNNNNAVQSSAPGDNQHVPLSPVAQKYISNLQDAVRNILDSNRLYWNSFGLRHEIADSQQGGKSHYTITITSSARWTPTWDDIVAKVKALSSPSLGDLAQFDVEITQPVTQQTRIKAPYNEPPALGDSIGLTRRDYQGSGTLGGYIELQIDGKWVLGALTNDHVVDWWKYPAFWDDKAMKDLWDEQRNGPWTKGKYEPERDQDNHVLTFSPGEMDHNETYLDRVQNLDTMGKTTRSVIPEKFARTIAGSVQGTVLESVGQLQGLIQTFDDVKVEFKADMASAKLLTAAHLCALKGEWDEKGPQGASIDSVKWSQSSHRDHALSCLKETSNAINSIRTNGTPPSKVAGLLDQLIQVASMDDPPNRYFGYVAFESGNAVSPSDLQRLDWAFIRACGPNLPTPDKINDLELVRKKLRDFAASARKPLSKLADVKSVTQFGQIQPNSFVVKVGNETEATAGYVDDALYTYKDRPSDEGGPFAFWPILNTEYNPFSKAGDSGSFVLDGEGKLVGLLFAGAEAAKLTGATDINVVLRDLVRKSGATGVRLPGGSEWKDPCPLAQPTQQSQNNPQAQSSSSSSSSSSSRQPAKTLQPSQNTAQTQSPSSPLLPKPDKKSCCSIS